MGTAGPTVSHRIELVGREAAVEVWAHKVALELLARLRPPIDRIALELANRAHARADGRLQGLALALELADTTTVAEQTVANALADVAGCIWEPGRVAKVTGIPAGLFPRLDAIPSEVSWTIAASTAANL